MVRRLRRNGTTKRITGGSARGEGDKRSPFDTSEPAQDLIRGRTGGGGHNRSRFDTSARTGGGATAVRSFMRLACLCLVTTLSLAASVPMAAAAETVAIVHAQAWTLSDPAGGRIDDATIVIVDGRFDSVQAHAPPPPQARIIDAHGRIVTPGLMSANTHLGIVEVSSLDETRDGGVESGPLGAAFDVQYALNANSVLLPAVLADGLTRAATSPTAASDAAFIGIGAVVRVVPGRDILDRAHSALYAAIGGGAAKKGGGSRSAQWQLLRNAFDEAKTYAPKPGAGPRDQLQNAINVAALRAALDRHMPLVLQVA
ncbi:MAG TPA: hypothetical protein VLN42_10770, partial [Casimicrobiaceae bacterium]|nr:hypothetical protein [Casimicrobiaceae bacterium]